VVECQDMNVPSYMICVNINVVRTDHLSYVIISVFPTNKNLHRWKLYMGAIL